VLDPTEQVKLYEYFTSKSFILKTLPSKSALIVNDMNTLHTIGGGVPVAKLTLELEITHAQSLKDRRQVVRSMKDKLRHGFNLSIAELDDGVVWNRATLGIAAISSSTPYLTGQLHQIDQAAHRIAAALSAEILDSYAEILPE
jgi:uncharacterized protein